MTRLLLICLGGALGTGLRYVVTGAAAHWLGADFPHGTLIVNLLGSFLIGLVQQVGMTTLVIPDTVRLFLTVGMLGGFTTYSAFSYETVRLAEFGAWQEAGISVAATTLPSLALCFLGIAAGRTLVALRR